MARLALRALGMAVGGIALLAAFSQLQFRMETMEEYYSTLWIDVVIGCTFGLSIVLVTLPLKPNVARRQYVRTTISALALSTIVSGCLVLDHFGQYRVRSHIPAVHDR